LEKQALSWTNLTEHSKKWIAQRPAS